MTLYLSCNLNTVYVQGVNVTYYRVKMTPKRCHRIKLVDMLAVLNQNKINRKTPNQLQYLVNIKGIQ